jgi:hypothetical protein
MGDEDEDQECKPQKFKMYTVARALVINPLVKVDGEIINCGEFSGSVGGKKGMGHLDMVPLPRQVVHKALAKWYAKNVQEFKEYTASFAKSQCHAAKIFNSSSSLGTSWFETAQAAFGAASAAWMNPGRCGPEGEGKFGWRVSRLKEMVKNAKLVDSEGETESIEVLRLKKENEELKAALTQINTATGGKLLWDEEAARKREIRVHARWRKKWQVDIQSLKGVETITLTVEPLKRAAPGVSGASGAAARPRSPSASSASSGASDSVQPLANPKPAAKPATKPAPALAQKPDSVQLRRSSRSRSSLTGGDAPALPWLLHTIATAVSAVDGLQGIQLENADVLKFNALLVRPEFVNRKDALPPYVYALVSLRGARLQVVVPKVTGPPALASEASQLAMHDQKRLVFVEPDILGLVCESDELDEQIHDPPQEYDDLFKSMNEIFPASNVLALPIGEGGKWTYHRLPGAA